MLFAIVFCFLNFIMTSVNSNVISSYSEKSKNIYLLKFSIYTEVKLNKSLRSPQPQIKVQLGTIALITSQHP
jgi:hypothetical protein